MIKVKEDMTNVYLGEGTIGIGVTLDSETKRPCGICFCELEEKVEIGTTIKSGVWSSLNNVNIIFSNETGIKSLLEGIERFVELYMKWEAERGDI